jgi:lysyl-tRNA synthetase class II
MTITAGSRHAPSLRTLAASIACVFGLSYSAHAQTGTPPALNDYPTEARAEYVFACMATNGQTSDVLRRCSCSIDVIASIIPHAKYVEAETVLSMQLVGGERMSLFRTAASAKRLVADLRRAQAEADILCF